MAVGPARLPAPAAARRAAPPRPASAGAAPCRDRRARRRGCPRCCRHRARASDRGRGSRPWRAPARARSAVSIWPSLPPRLRVESPASSRATCMVMRRGAGDRPAVRHELPGGAEERAHIDAAMLAEAPVLIGDQRLDEERVDVGERRRAAASARRRWRRGGAARRCGRGRRVPVSGVSGGSSTCATAYLQRERRGGREEAGGDEGSERSAEAERANSPP